jgi:hypothetical protein
MTAGSIFATDDTMLCVMGYKENSRSTSTLVNERYSRFFTITPSLNSATFVLEFP